VKIVLEHDDIIAAVENHLAANFGDDNITLGEFARTKKGLLSVEAHIGDAPDATPAEVEAEADEEAETEAPV